MIARFSPVLAALALTLSAAPLAAEMVVGEGYARASNTRAGAAFLTVENTGETADRLVDVRSDAAQRVELHVHRMNAEGVMSMAHAEEGFEVAAGETLVLERGGKHVMFLGLSESWEQGDSVELTLVFETAGEVEVTLPVDLER